MIDEELRNAIRASGQTCYALAWSAGVRPEMLSRFLSGERDLRLATAAKVANVLGLVLTIPKAKTRNRKPHDDR